MKTFLGVLLFTWAVTVNAKVMVYSLVMTNTITRSDSSDAVTQVLYGRLVFVPKIWPLGLPGNARVLLWGKDVWGEDTNRNVFGIDCPGIDNGWPLWTSKTVTKWKLTWPDQASLVTLRGNNVRLWWTANGYIFLPQILRGTTQESFTRDGVTFTTRGNAVARFLGGATRSANKQFLTPPVAIENFANVRRVAGDTQLPGSCP